MTEWNTGAMYCSCEHSATWATTLEVTRYLAGILGDCEKSLHSAKIEGLTLSLKERGWLQSVGLFNRFDGPEGRQCTKYLTRLPVPEAQTLQEDWVSGSVFENPFGKCGPRRAERSWWHAEYECKLICTEYTVVQSGSRGLLGGTE